MYSKLANKHTKKPVQLRIWVFSFLLILPAVACNYLSPTRTAPDTLSQGTVQPTQNQERFFPTSTPPNPNQRPITSPAPALPPAPVRDADGNPIFDTRSGNTSRLSPAPPDSSIWTYRWQIQQREILRGEAALAKLQTNAAIVSLPEEGFEYILVNLSVRNHTSDIIAKIYSFHFSLTGTKHYDYRSQTVVGDLAPLDGELSQNQHIEGWLIFLIPTSENNLELVYNPNDSQYPPVYWALEAGASIATPSDLAGLQANDIGKTPDNPARPDQTSRLDDWELSVLRIIHGDPAWEIIQSANMFNDPALDGFQYVLVEINIHFIHPTAYSVISPVYFETVNNELEPFPNLTVAGLSPNFFLIQGFFPGAAYRAWIAKLAPIRDTTVLLQFETPLNYPEAQQETRYFLLPLK